MARAKSSGAHVDYRHHPCVAWIEFIKDFVMYMIRLNGNKVLVVGLGKRTGLAACNFLSARGYDVTGNDVKDRSDLTEIVEKLNPSVRIVAGHQSPTILNDGFDFVVLSPGVPRSIPLIVEAQKRHIPVISEIELAFRFMKGYIIGITGTDGKSTTTALTGHILKELGEKTIVGGNIGIPLIGLVDSIDDETVSVIELSSFQLETIDSFRPDVAAILNITPDHLDRYANMEEYALAKMRIAKNQKPEDVFVYYADDERIAQYVAHVAATQLTFSLTDDRADAFLCDGAISVRWGGLLHRMLDVREMKLVGLHNALNAMASALMVCAILARMDRPIDFLEIGQCIARFSGLPHRMETLGEFAGRIFINDSKATTVGAVEMAVRNFTGNAVLILGGRTKGDDYSRLAKNLKGKIRALVLIGESQDEFKKIFSEFAPRCADSLEDAVREALSMSHPGDSILLSPACASFDMFTNYEHRGEVFRTIFEKLKRGEISWT
ncbi:MAG: UDP-N-acetylmuramoyl-L-alanine--D-glutamate ligase [Spirochaetes bacterium]|nr:UDP-N-acetylmuramoyl-L-alanine--D-glutamate ligase [Spirochaetota bacterium]